MSKKNSFEIKINNLTKYHFNRSKEYKQILKVLGYKNKNTRIEELPFLTTSIFKELDLKSVSLNKIYKVFSSSGTSSQKRSKIFLDLENSISQRRVLKEIFERNFGKKRLPMLIVGKSPKNINENFDAKYAAILGFSIFGSNHTFLIDEDNKINLHKLENFLTQYSKNKFLVFGFTYEIYDLFINKLKKRFNFENAILIHGGGWKKLEDKKVSNIKFKNLLYKKLNLNKIYNYYGLIEQVGSIFFECQECNNFICSEYSNVFIRNERLEIINQGRGFVQLMSLLPKSYPGHNILTDDIGEIITNSKCRINHRGKSFKIYGRVEKSEIRGCSDV